jgi:phage/plasmid-associated DNA primase
MPPQCVRDATTAYLKAEDAVGQWMAECCAQRRRSADQTRLRVAEKLGRAKQRNLGSKKAFTQKLEDRGYGQRHGQVRAAEAIEEAR